MSLAVRDRVGPAALAAGAAALVLAVTACDKSGPGAPVEPPATTTPAAATSAVSADLTLTATQIRTNGSVGTPTGTVRITIRNNGTTAPKLILEFQDVPTQIEFTGAAWAGCQKSDDGMSRIATCPLDPVPAGSSKTIPFEFRVSLEELERVGTVILNPVEAQERDIADNTVELSICTNGCTT